MALLFSAVYIAAGKNGKEFLVSGIPKQESDLSGWTAYENLRDDIASENVEILARTSSYLYGDGEVYMASPEEVAYFMMRIEHDPQFLSEHCKFVQNGEFQILAGEDIASEYDYTQQ